MLQNLRDQKNSWLIVLLFAIIIIVFVFMFGLPSMDAATSKSHSSPATVGKHEITHDMLRSVILQHYDDNVFSSKNYPSVAYATVESLATVYLLADSAREAGLRVTDEELQDYITNWEAGNPDVLRYGFLRQNQFSKRNYDDAVSRMMMSTRDYEDYKREELLARRYLTLLSASVDVSEQSLWEKFAEENASAALEYVRITPDKVRLTFPAVTDQDIDAYLAEHAADVENYYNEHLGDYTTKPKAKLHQVVIQKNPLKLTNPGAKTIKTYQPAERFSIARTQINEQKLDFAQAVTDYDESEDKSSLGITALLSIDIMDPALQTALEGKKVDDIVTAELPDRFIIAKVLETTEKIVTPLDDVKRDIARKLFDDARVAQRTKDASAAIIAQAQSGTPLEAAVEAVLYAGIPTEKPEVAVVAPDSPSMGLQGLQGGNPSFAIGVANLTGDPLVDVLGQNAPTVVPNPAADANAANAAADAAAPAADAANAAAPAADAADANAAAPAADAAAPAAEADAANAAADAAPTVVPDDLIVIPEVSRIQVATVSDTSYDTAFIQNIGTNDDLARDIRAAAPNTVLASAYAIGLDTVIVRVVSKTPANHDSFANDLEERRIKAIDAKIAVLIGDPEKIVYDLNGGRGVWIEQKLQKARTDGTLVINNEYFNALAARYDKVEK